MKTLAIVLAVVVVLALVWLTVRQSAPEDTGAVDPDLSVLIQLQKAGSDLSQPHPIEFFLYFPTQQAAEQAADRVSSMGFHAEAQRAADDSAWLCLAKKEMVPEHAALQEITKTFTSLASELNGEYDGWGTPVVR